MPSQEVQVMQSSATKKTFSSLFGKFIIVALLFPLLILSCPGAEADSPSGGDSPLSPLQDEYIPHGDGDTSPEPVQEEYAFPSRREGESPLSPPIAVLVERFGALAPITESGGK